jgi:hypothetical protein
VRPGGDLPVGRFVDRAVESFFGFSERYFCSHLTQITSRTFRIPPHQRGVSRSSRTRGAEAVDAAAFCAQRDCRAGDEPVSDHQASGREMLQRTAKSCGPDAPTLVSSLRSCVGPTGLRQNISADDGGKRARSPRRARHKLLKPLRAGMPGDSGVLVYSCAFYQTQSAHEAAGATGIRHSPRPLLGER